VFLVCIGECGRSCIRGLGVGLVLLHGVLAGVVLSMGRFLVMWRLFWWLVVVLMIEHGFDD